MRTCEICGAEQLDNAIFCGNCGRTVDNSMETPTSGNGLPIVKMNTIESADTIKASQWEYAPQDPPRQTYKANKANKANSTQGVPNNDWQPLNDEENEEEKRRRTALLGLVGFAGDMQPQAGTVPMVQGHPQFGGVPSVQGTQGNSFVNNPAQGSYPLAFHSSPTIQAPPFGRRPMPPSSIRPGTPRNPNPNRPPTQPSGCAPVWLIFLFAIILIISGIVTIGLTVLSPSLSTLSGNTDVTIGNSLQLHGNSFIPGSSVVLTLDNTVPLFYTEWAAPPHALYGVNSVLALSRNAFSPAKTNATNNVVSVSLDGSFTVQIAIDASWHTGEHSIRASEKFTPRNAVITINVQAAGQTPTSIPSATVSPSPTASVSPSASASATVTTADLGCVTPTSVSLGPVSEGYSQAVSSQVSLCTIGTGTVNWTASWDKNMASWLQLDRSSGQIQAPAQQQIKVSALATNLKAGSYTTIITFSNLQSSTTEALNVTFTVQTGCITASQKTLSFTGVAGVSDPQPQMLTVANCGLVGTWSTAVTTTNNVNWLSTTPTGGSLNDNATQSVTIMASNLKTQLSEGTYSGSITFSIGTNQVVVSVTLSVQAGPKIIVVVPNPPSFNAATQCTFSQSLNAWTCIASISNSSSTQSLTWQSSSTGVATIAFKPASGTLAPSGGTRVIIIVPKNDCQTATTLTFTGPVNAQSIVWSCTLIP